MGTNLKRNYIWGHANKRLNTTPTKVARKGIKYIKSQIYSVQQAAAIKYYKRGGSVGLL
jgi:hypothetical protein